MNTVYFQHTFGIHVSLYLAYSLSCCSHLELRASVKRFVSLQFPRELVGLLGRGISPSQGRYLQHKHRINANIHALSGIQTYDPSVRAVEDKFNALDRAATFTDRPVFMQRWEIQIYLQRISVPQGCLHKVRMYPLVQQMDFSRETTLHL
jgi:hypothetical protein